MIAEIRDQIDKIDDDLVRLFVERLSLVEEIAAKKKDENLPVLNSARELEIMDRLTKGLVENEKGPMAGYAKTLFGMIFGLSRFHQSKLLGTSSKLADDIRFALENTPTDLPETASVACQGSMGANSIAACERLFKCPLITYVDTFESVFKAVDSGLCRYGILPIENNLHGSVTDVYNLMKKYSFYIVKSVKLKINHALLAKHGVKISDIRRIRSHEQALGQCSDFLRDLKSSNNMVIEYCSNTATAAKEISEDDARDVAAISSRRCAELYDLTVLRGDIQNSDDNYTKFICISKQLEIYPGAEKNSMMVTVPHRPGALNQLIAKFAEFGINLTKIESRLPPNKDEPVFYIDFDLSVYNEAIFNLLSDLEIVNDDFEFLGCYSEKT